MVYPEVLETELLIEAVHRLRGLDRKLDFLLTRINQQGRAIMMDFSAVTAKIEAETTVVASVKTLMEHLAQEIIDAKGDQTKLDALVAQLQANNDTLAQAVVTGTAADAPATPPAPAPVTPDQP